ncbi:Uncharacterised protein [Escherichia coli]|uniref:Uncharacterized protein n=1 Tax=Escherichia coli TaxID=562 RepID=A0A2X3LQN8_ECOLX|nr:Uncharacterised protein [Escherichia coli]
MNIAIVTINQEKCRNSKLAGGAGFQRLYPGALAD